MNIRAKIMIYLYLISIIILAILTFPGGLLNRTFIDEYSTLDEIKKRGVWEFNLYVPKKGFIGGPILETMVRRSARKEIDFDMHNLRVIETHSSIIEKNKFIFYRLDLLDEQKQIYEKGLYYSALIVNDGGAFVNQFSESDDIDLVYYRGVNLDIPFPFRSTRSPSLGFKKSRVEGFLDCSGCGVKYEIVNGTGRDSYYVINTIEFGIEDNIDELKIPQYGIKYFGEEINDILNRHKIWHMNSERQIWIDSYDAFWIKMERYDKDGNIIMKCVRIK